MKKTLPRTVLILGLVSFFNDLASEMVVPLLPILLATVLGAGPVALGLVEGVADAVASLLKLWSGRHTDLQGGRRKPLTVAGYLLSNLVRPLLSLAVNWPMVVLLRSVDRVGKGLRSAPRDAMIADITPPAIKSYAYGIRRAMDNAGALGGSLIAAAVLAWSPLSITQVIMWSALPGMLGVLLIAFGVREPARHVQESANGILPPLSWAALSAPMRHYLLTLLTFSFARTSETFILLRGYQLGMGTVQLLLLWGALNLSKVLTSTFGGRMADAGHKPRLMLASWIAFAVSFFLFGQISGHGWVWLVSCAYGLMIGLSEGAERALISDFAAVGERGTAFGWYHLVVGVAAIPAGLVFGGLWHYAGAQAAFSFAALTAAAASLMLYFWTLRHKQ